MCQKGEHMNQKRPQMRFWRLQKIEKRRQI